jgi:hypothetical protein
MRGAHSTGLFGVQKETKKDIVEWVKRVGPPHGLMSEPESKKFMDRMFSRYHAVVAHGRYATTGKINAKNAHPFHHGNIILVHNGSVRNLWNLKIDGESIEKKFEVDSEALTYMFSKVGVKDTLKEVTGALSLIWYDRSTRCLHALRNTERPMFLMQRTDVPQIFFSSEMETLEYVINKYPSIKAKEIKTLAPDHLYTFPLGSDNTLRIEREKVKVGSWGYQPIRHMGGGRHTNFDAYGDMHDLFTPELDRIAAASRLQIEEADRARPTTGGQVVPFVRRPTLTVPIKTGNGEDERARLTEITRFGVKFRVGEWTAFYPQHSEIIGKENKTWYIHGDHPALRNVSVACHYKGDVASLKDEILLAGEIESIMALNEEKASGYTLRVYVKNLTRISHHVQNRILNKEVFDLKAEMDRNPPVPGLVTTPTLTLKSGAQLSMWRFEQLASDKCAKCGGEIDLPDAPGCLLVNDLSDASPKEKIHGGLICPDCVIHSVVH